MQTPVLFLVFNRPENTRQTFRRIREAKPSKLWIHADGPRPNRPGEAQKCAAVRTIFDEIDWPCEVVRIFRDENRGVKKGISNALNQFFSIEKWGIILEDDCLADPSFFPFCEELLLKYEADERVMHISGHNWILPSNRSVSPSYVFTNYAIVSAWASWSRAWKHLDLDMKGLNEFKKSGRFDTFLPNPLSRRYLLKKFEAVQTGLIDSWAFPWFFTVARMGGLGILPIENLVENIGISQADATNTTGGNDPRTLKAMPMRFPLHHPEKMERSSKFDQQLFYKTHKSFWRLIVRELLSFIGLIK